MAIGVSYTGSEGQHRVFSLDGVPSRGSMADALFSMHGDMNQLYQNPIGDQAVSHGVQSEIPQIPSMADSVQQDEKVGLVKLMAGDMPETLDRKIDPNGSITIVGNSICLKGDQGVSGRRFYGSNNGVRGFFSIADLDPDAGSGNMCIGEGSTPDGSMADFSGGRTGATVRIGGRTDYSTDPAGNTVIKEFFRIARITPNGRIISISDERERDVLTVNLNTECKYGVRPFWVEENAEDNEHPTLKALAFGLSSDLDTWDGSKFTCNDGNEKPVKIVAVEEYSGNIV